MNSTSELAWDASVWKEIDDAVLAEMGRVRSAQKTTPQDHHPESAVKVSKASIKARVSPKQ